MAFIRTFYGTKFDLANPLPGNMHLRDVAMSMSNTCRWVGYVKTHLSTAQHSVLVSYRCEELARQLIAKEAWARAKMHFGDLVHMAALVGFGHDFAEAWYGDVSSPLKNMPEMESYRVLERRAMVQVGIRWNMDFFHPVLEPLMHRADKKVAATESRDFREEDTPERRALIQTALPGTIIPLSAAEAHEVFMRRAAELGVS